jgi:imidazolonepropionase-like amidohydrolase
LNSISERGAPVLRRGLKRIRASISFKPAVLFAVVLISSAVGVSAPALAGTEELLFEDGFEAIQEGIVSCPSPPAGSIPGQCEAVPGDGNLLIRSSFASPDVLYRNAELLIDDAGVIQCAGCDCSATPGYNSATVLNCAQVLTTPGLINAHEHLTFQGTPVDTGSERFDHRHDWRLGLRGHSQISVTGGTTAAAQVGGETRHLLGGATSMIGSGSRPGMVRNLDNLANQDGLAGPRVDVDTFPLGDSNGTLIESGCAYPGSPQPNLGQVYHAHIAEGVDLAARNEWLCSSTILQNTDPTLPGPSIVHGIAMTADDIASLVAARASLVWSPRSDIMLYGMTAPVSMLASQGINLVLGTNWASTGSMNMLRELACAREHNETGLNSYFTAQDLLRMATSNAADAAGVGDRIGRIESGFIADLSLFDASVHSDFAAAVEADQEDVILVLKAGSPLFGDEAVVDALSDVPGTCELMGDTVPGDCMADKRICLVGETGLTYATVNAAMVGLQPLYSCGGPPAGEPSCLPARDEGDGIVYTGIATPTDTDGDGVADDTDNCPLQFNPPRPVDNFQQADGDLDGIGDVCDPEP